MQLPLFAEDDVLKRKLLQVHERLCEEYHCPIPYFHHFDPLSELVSSLLSHRTRNRVSGQAFRNLRERFGTSEPGWREMMSAPVREIEALIADVTWPEQKARSIQRILREIAERRNGSLSLEWLGDLAVPVARDWLESIPGIGPKTSAAVLSFSTLRKRALPVDSHHHRVAARLGFIAKSVSVGSAHVVLERLLPPEWDAQAVYDHHEVLMIHGQKCCFFQSPACQRCVVLDLCPTGQQRMSELSGMMSKVIDRSVPAERRSGGR